MAVYVTRSGVALTVGIIILAGLLVGGLLWVKDSGEQARREEAVKIAEQKLEEESKKDVALNEGDEKKSDKKSEEKSGTNNGGTGNTSGSDALPGTGSDLEELPQTGATENALISLVVIALLVFAGSSYWRSRSASL